LEAAILNISKRITALLILLVGIQGHVYAAPEYANEETKEETKEVNEFEWPGHGGKTYHEVKMTFVEKPVIGKSALDYFVLYIDPATNLLAGYQYAVGNRALLDSLGQPPERKLFGPLWRVITKNQTVDGLVFPAAFRTMPEADERIVGNHIVTHLDVSTPFDQSLLQMPEGAIVDDVANQ
jgi:hypothetical protein